MKPSVNPQLGITIRTAVAFLILAALSAPQWRSLAQAPLRVWVLMIVGGGVVAGAVGMALTVGGIVLLSL